MSLREGQVIIKNARGAYLKLFKPEAVKGDPNAKPRYGCQILLPKTDTKTKAAIDAEIDRLAKVHFKGAKPKSKDLCIKDGDGEDGDANSAGYWVISANRAEKQGPPDVVDRNPSVRLTQSDVHKVYGGARFNFVVSFYVPANWGKVCAALEVVQFVADDEPFGAGRVKADAVLANLEDEDEDI